MACFGKFWTAVFVRALASHCNASNPVLEILKHDKIWRGNLHRRPRPKFWGIHSPQPMIYARGSCFVSRHTSDADDTVSMFYYIFALFRKLLTSHRHARTLTDAHNAALDYSHYSLQHRNTPSGMCTHALRLQSVPESQYDNSNNGVPNISRPECSLLAGMGNAL